MDVVLSKHDTIWQGMTDFETSNLLPNIESVLEEEDNILFLPLHVLDHTIGYAALVYEPDQNEYGTALPVSYECKYCT